MLLLRSCVRPPPEPLAPPSKERRASLALPLRCCLGAPPSPGPAGITARRSGSLADNGGEGASPPAALAPATEGGTPGSWRLPLLVLL